MSSKSFSPRLRHLLSAVILSAMLLALGLLSVACVPNAECTTTQVSFSKCVAPLLLANCSGGGCHGGDTPEFGLQLERDIYKNIVGVNSAQGFPLKQIEPGDPDGSYLYLKLIQDNPKGGARMPLERGILWPEQLEAIRTWIAEGAKDN